MPVAKHAHVSPQDLLGFPLPERGPDGISAAGAERLIEDLGRCVPWEVLGPHIAFDPRGYVRKRLYRDADWEMLLLCWLPGQKTVVHDHGGAWGAVRMLSGVLHEARYQWRGPGEPLVEECDRLCEGPVVMAESVETIHKNENRSPYPAISLHLYSPPLKVLNSYDPVSGERHEVKLAEGPAIAIGGNPRLGPGRKGSPRTKR